MTKEETKQTVEEAAIEARMASAETLTTYGTHTSLDDFEYLSHDEIAEAAFVKGAEWQSKQPPLDKCEGTVAGGRKACINKT